jgi:hypothetical protein
MIHVKHSLSEWEDSINCWNCYGHTKEPNTIRTCVIKVKWENVRKFPIWYDLYATCVYSLLSLLIKITVYGNLFHNMLIKVMESTVIAN